MKKRIIASTMASVMALSAGSSMIASAAVKDYTSVASATKADLQKLLADKDITAIIENGAVDYGSITGGHFMKAVEYAQAVIDDINAGNDQATVAYQMVIATYNRLAQHDSDELTRLVADWKPTYDTNNELNELGDAIYTESTWTTFKDAWEEADDYKSYEDLIVTTDAYDKLLDAANNLKKKEQKTKGEIADARENFEKALKETEFKWQPWMRGEVSGTSTDYDGKKFAWGALYAHIKSGEEALKSEYSRFDQYKSVAVTSNDEIVNAVNALVMATKVLKGFSVKGTSTEGYEKSTQSAVKNLLDDYHGQLVYTYNADKAAEIVLDLLSVASASKALDAVKVRVNGKDQTLGALNLATTTFTAGADHEANKTSYWNTKFSGETKYAPLTYTTADKVKKVIDADLYVTQTTTTKLYYVTNDDNKVCGSNGEIVKDPATGHYFLTAEQAKALAETNSGYNQRSLSKNTSMNLSNFIGVTAVDIGETILAAPNAALTAALEADQDCMDALDAITGLASDIADQLTSVETQLAALLAEVKGLKTTAATNAASMITADVTLISTAIANLTSAGSVYASLTAAADTVKAMTAVTDYCDVDMQELFLQIDYYYSAFKSDLNKLYSSVASGLTTETKAQLKGSGKVAAALKKVQDASNVLNNAKDAKFDKTSAQTGSLAKIVSGSAVKKAHDAFIAAYSNVLLAQAGDKVNNVIAGDSTKPANHANEFVDVWGEISTTDDFNNNAKGLAKLMSDFWVADGVTTHNDEYVSSKIEGSDTLQKCSDTTVSLLRAMVLSENFNRKIWEDVQGLDNSAYVKGEIKDGKAVATRAWAILYLYAKYALEDEFRASVEDTYTRADVEDLLEKSYRLAENTVETSLFNYSHMNLYNARNGASDWVKLSYGDGSAYKDNDSAYNVDYTGDGELDGSLNSTGIYKKLNDAYKQLKKEYDAFAYSYGEIVKQMAAIATALDTNTEISASDKTKIAAALEKAADAFVKVQAVHTGNAKQSVTQTIDGYELDDSELFNTNATINIHNRLFTQDAKLDYLRITDEDDNTTYVQITINKSKGGTANGDNLTHYNMRVAYEDLIKLYNEATKAPEESNLDLDVNGDTFKNIDDVSALIDLILTGKAVTSKHDFNKSGKVDIDDVSWLLDELLGLHK